MACLLVFVVLYVWHKGSISLFVFHKVHFICKFCLCKMAILKKTENWFSRPIIASCGSNVLHNAPRGAFCNTLIRPSLSYLLSLRFLFCIFLSGRFTQVLLYYFLEVLMAAIVWTYKQTK